MLKQSLIYLIISIIVVMFASYAHLIIIYIGMIYTYVNIKITPLFVGTPYGMLIRNICSLVILPIFFAGLPACVYWAIKKRPLPYFIECTWVFWLIIVLSKFLIQFHP